MYTFNHLYNRYQNYFIHKYGQAKFNKIEEKILKSSKLAQVNGASIQRKTTPTRADFSSYIHGIPYFMFAGVETIAMAEFVSIKYWKEEINSVYNLCTEHELFVKAEAITNHWKIKL
jgi:hypothetical protein